MKKPPEKSEFPWELFPRPDHRGLSLESTQWLVNLKFKGMNE
jgi:hypothetical protein